MLADARGGNLDGPFSGRSFICLWLICGKSKTPLFCGGPWQTHAVFILCYLFVAGFHGQKLTDPVSVGGGVATKTELVLVKNTKERLKRLNK